MDYASLKSLTGFELKQIELELDRVLSKDAYTAVPGGAALTDIDPAYMREELNKLFGVCGIGWGYAYSPDDIQMEVVKRGQGSTNSAIVKKLTFWYKLVGTNGEIVQAEVPSSGGSLNDVPGYAVSGAITNAISKAVSNIGFQRSVYLGVRSHKNVDGAHDPSASKPAAPKPAAPKPAPKASAPSPAPKQPASKAAQTDDEIVDDVPVPVAADVNADFVIPTGVRKGQKLRDQDLKVLSWYANELKPANDDQKKLQAAAQSLMKVKGNGRIPQSTAA